MNKIVFAIAFSVIAFASGWYVSHTRDTAKHQQYIIQMQEALEAQQKKAQELSQSLQEVTNEADQAQAKAERDITADYEQRLERLRHDNIGASGKDMPNPASSTCKISTSISEHNARIRQAFRELRADVLTIARERDITASHYNELISLYNDLLNKINKEDSTNGK